MKRSVIIAVVLLLGGVAQAAPQPTGLAFHAVGAPAVSSSVSQQPGVTNPRTGTPCAWDDADHWMQAAQGTLVAGQSGGVAECVIADTSSGSWSSMTVNAPSNALTVTECFAPSGVCTTAAPVFNPVGKIYDYAVCGRAGYDPADVQPIANSNGGVGVQQSVTFSIVNGSRKQVANVQVVVYQGNGAGGTGCSGIPHSQYPVTFLG